MKRKIVIQGAEGGKDAKLFVTDLAQAYAKLFERKHWTYDLNKLSNCIELNVEGKDLSQLDKEAGGHRVQRVPPTEKKGRVHTSSVTVSVIDPGIQSDKSYGMISDSDFRVEWFSGTGKGGQHRNKKQNSCRLHHIPTGIVEARQGRKRESNYKDARDAILRRLEENSLLEKHSTFSDKRKQQVGSGMRGDKIRTYRLQDDQVTDHVRGTRAKCTKVLKGQIDLLWR